MSHFQFSELFAHCQSYEINEVLGSPYLSANLVKCFLALNSIRDEFGFPIIVNSCYRSKHHNSLVNGAKNSDHIKCLAFDITSSINFKKLVSVVLSHRELYRYIELHKNFIHVSLRSSDDRSACIVKDSSSNTFLSI